MAGPIGEIDRAKPVDNPFVVGNPVTGALFVGREDILGQLEELWGNDPQLGRDSVVLYGHRRMGKTSILQNLGRHRFGVDTLVAYFSMQDLSEPHGSDELLLALAYRLFDTLEDAGLTVLPPDKANFDGQGSLAFSRFLRQVEKVIGGKRLILTLDEFELLEKAIQAGRVEASIIDKLRGTIHQEAWFLLALAGLHTLKEMTQDYWHPLYASVKAIRVSFLSEPATLQLLVNPHPEFTLDLTAAVGRVYELTYGQPYLVQAIGHNLVRQFNEALLQGQPRSHEFGAVEVEAVVATDQFYQDGHYYFDGVWSQAGQGAGGQQAILRALVNGLLTRAELVAVNPAITPAGLDALEQHDIIHRQAPQAAERYAFTVPLMAYWVKRYKI